MSGVPVFRIECSCSDQCGSVFVISAFKDHCWVLVDSGEDQVSVSISSEMKVKLAEWLQQQNV